MPNLKAHERNLLNSMKNFDNLELAGGGATSSGTQAQLKNIVGNPVFSAQFNFQFFTYYQNITVPALVAAAALPAAIQTQQSWITFGNSDYAGGFPKSLQYVPDPVYAQTFMGIFGKEANAATVGLVAPFCLRGDLIMTWRAVTGGVTYERVNIIRCPQVAYGTLLDSLNSDTFLINMIRYRVNPLQLGQLNNQIIPVVQSLFGKAQDDKIDPSTYVTGQTFNQNIADIPVEIAIDKTKSLCTYSAFDVIAFDWVITVAYSKKVRLA